MKWDFHLMLTIALKQFRNGRTGSFCN